MSNIIEKFKAQSISAQIHFQNGEKKITPRPDKPPKYMSLERQCNCLRYQNGHSAFIDLFKAPGATKAHYKGLQTCGSVHSCPICATKITEYRKKEIEDLLEKTIGKHHYLVTLTIPHYINESCKDVRDKFLAARRRLKNWNDIEGHNEFVSFRKTLKHYQYDGSVTTVEVTFGQNGWHIHSHELFIFDKKIDDLKKFREIVFANWTKAVIYSDIQIKNASAFFKRSVRIDELGQDHKNIMTSYLTKVGTSETWGMSMELTKGNLKKQQNGNITPFGMLFAIVQAPTKIESRTLYNKYQYRFWEYCQTFKGKQFIRFSKNLKNKYGIAEIKDQDIVNMDDLLSQHYGWFEPKTEWEEIKKFRLRGWVLEKSDLDWAQLTKQLTAKLGELKNGKAQNKTLYENAG